MLCLRFLSIRLLHMRDGSLLRMRDSSLLRMRNGSLLRTRYVTVSLHHE